MLVKLSKKNLKQLNTKLMELSGEDCELFHPHEFDIRTLEQLVSRKRHWYYLYYDTDEFIAYGFLRLFSRYKVPTLGCVIWKEHRHNGYGKKLVNELVCKAKELGFNTVKIHVYIKNSVALGLYLHSNFKIVEFVMERNT